tara:strand:+ start:828 stop:1259 length:432 start_codon:yes stop_codon:yes gene_type:complete
MNIFQKQTLVWGGIGAIAFTFIANSVKADTQVQDHYKNIIYKTPSQVEVCYDRQVSGDKTGDAIKGAIIGGILGNNIKGEKDGGAIGAIIGGMLGHSNSGAIGGTKRVCQVETRYSEESKRVYSHSTISFVYEGKSYRVNFQK